MYDDRFLVVFGGETRSKISSDIYALDFDNVLIPPIVLSKIDRRVPEYLFRRLPIVIPIRFSACVAYVQTLYSGGRKLYHSTFLQAGL